MGYPQGYPWITHQRYFLGVTLIWVGFPRYYLGGVYRRASLMYDDHIALPPKFMNSAGAMAAIFDMSLMAHFESSPACLQEIQSSGVWLTQKKCFGCWTLHKQLSWMPGSLIKHITSANHCANPT